MSPIRYSSWDKLPEEFRERYAGQKDSVEELYALGCEICQRRKGDTPWRLKLNPTKETWKIGESTNFKEILSKNRRRLQMARLDNGVYAGNRADTELARSREEDANRFVEKLTNSLLFIQPEDIRVVWLDNGEQPYIRSKLLFGKKCRQYSHDIEENLFAEAMRSDALGSRIAHKMESALNEPPIIQLIHELYESAKSRVETPDIVCPNITEEIKLTVSMKKMPSLEMTVKLIVGLSVGRAETMQVPFCFDQTQSLGELAESIVRTFDFSPCFKRALAAPGSKLEGRIYGCLSDVQIGNKMAEVCFLKPETQMVDGRYVVEQKNGSVSGLVLETGIVLEVLDSSEESFLSAWKKQARTDSESVLTMLQESVAVARYGLHLKATLRYCPKVYPWQNEPGFECRISVFDGAKEFLLTTDIMPDNSYTEAKSCIRAAQDALKTAEAGVLKYAVQNNFSQIYLVGGKEKLKAALLSVILRPDKRWRKDEFTRKEILGMFGCRFPGKYSAQTVSGALTELLTAYGKQNASEEFAVFAGHLMKGDHFDCARYHVIDEKLAKGLLRALDNSSFQWSDIGDLKTSARFPKFRKLALAVKSSEDAFWVIENLSLLTRGDAANFLKSDAFTHVAEQLDGTDRLLASVIVRDYPGCIEIAKNLENDEEGEDFAHQSLFG